MGGDSSKNENEKPQTQPQQHAAPITALDFENLAEKLINRTADEILEILGKNPEVQKKIVTISTEEWEKLQNENKVLEKLATLRFSQAGETASKVSTEEKEVKCFLEYMNEKYDTKSEKRYTYPDDIRPRVPGNYDAMKDVADYNFGTLPNNPLNPQHNLINNPNLMTREMIKRQAEHQNAMVNPMHGSPLLKMGQQYVVAPSAVSYYQMINSPGYNLPVQNVHQYQHGYLPQNGPQFVRQNLPQNQPENDPQYRTQSGRNIEPLKEAQNVLQNASQNVPQNASQNITQNSPQNVSQNASQNVLRNASQNAPQNASHNAPQNAPQNVSQNASQNAPQNVPQNASQNASRNASQNAPQNAPQNVPQNASQNAPQNVSQNAPQNVSQNAPQNLPQNARQNAPQNAPQNVPQNASQNVPQNAPQNVPQNVPQNALNKHQNAYEAEMRHDFGRRNPLTEENKKTVQQKESERNPNPNVTKDQIKKTNNVSHNMGLIMPHQNKNRATVGPNEHFGLPIEPNNRGRPYTGAIPRRGNYRGNAFRGQNRRVGRNEERINPLLSVKTGLDTEKNNDKSEYTMGIKPQFKTGTIPKTKEYEPENKPTYNGNYQNRGRGTRIIYGNRGRGARHNYFITKSTENLNEDSNNEVERKRIPNRGSGGKYRDNRSKSATRQNNKPSTEKIQNNLDLKGAKDYLKSLEQTKNNNLLSDEKKLSENKFEKNINNNDTNLLLKKENNLEKVENSSLKDEKTSVLKEEKTEEEIKKAAELKKLKNERKSAAKKAKRASKLIEENIKTEDFTEETSEKLDKTDSQILRDELEKYFESQFQTLLIKHGTMQNKDLNPLLIIPKEELLNIIPSHWESKKSIAYNYLTKVPIDPNNPEYIRIENEFNKSVREQMNIEYILRIENPILLSMYQLKKEELTQFFGYEPEERLLFHGTHKNNITPIIENNLNWRKMNKVRHRFGQGVIFTPLASNASHHCLGKDIKQLILCKVMIFHERIGKEDTIIPPKGFDTTKRPDGKIIVKFDDSTFYPEYVIAFTGKMDDLQRNPYKKVNSDQVKG